MDKVTFFKKAFQRARENWKKDKEESEKMYGEGVLTRRQPKVDEIPPPPKETQPPKESEPKTPPEPPEPPEQRPSEAEKGPEDNKEKDDDKEADNIFNDETLVAKNNVLKVYVIKTFFKRQKKFNLQDHQYVVLFKKFGKEPILLDDVLDILEKAFCIILLLYCLLCWIKIKFC